MQCTIHIFHITNDGIISEVQQPATVSSNNYIFVCTKIEGPKSHDIAYFESEEKLFENPSEAFEKPLEESENIVESSPSQEPKIVAPLVKADLEI